MALYNPTEPCNLKCIWTNGCYRKELKKVFKGERHGWEDKKPDAPRGMFK